MLRSTIDYNFVGQNVRKARRDRNYTQEKLSELTGISMNHISHIEIGVSPLSLPALFTICEALCVTADRLLYDNLSQSNPTYLTADIKACFMDASPDESYVMLAVANAAKEAMRVKRNTEEAAAEEEPQ
jgi:transcriptional regulator with XRE-family HTH domain